MFNTTILFFSKVFNFWGLTSPLSCSLRTIFSFTTSLAPRLLSITIALYRWTCVCRSTSVLTSTQRRTFFLRLSSTVTILTLGLAAGAFYYNTLVLLVNMDYFSLFLTSEHLKNLRNVKLKRQWRCNIIRKIKC